MHGTKQRSTNGKIAWKPRLKHNSAKLK
jgi:hypothetical protein